MAALRKRNNVDPGVLMSDQAHTSTIGQIKNQSQKQIAKNNSEESMSTFAKMISPVCCLAATLIAAQPARAQSAGTTFFVTSVGIGNGANLGGLAGADNYCQTLAQAAGFGAPRTWRAYLSTQAADGQPAVNARDRIGKGPWQNFRGVVVAKDVSELRGAKNLTKQ